MMLGTILISAVILISGSAVATWVHVTYIAQNNTTFPGNIDGAPDNAAVSLGTTGPPPGFGWILCDLGLSNVMPNSQDFTVFAPATISVHNESYNVYVSPNAIDFTYVGTGWDSKSEIFTTPSTGGNLWRYIYLETNYGHSGDDPAPGPELDAVGWDKP